MTLTHWAGDGQVSLLSMPLCLPSTDDDADALGGGWTGGEFGRGPKPRRSAVVVAAAWVLGPLAMLNGFLQVCSTVFCRQLLSALKILFALKLLSALKLLLALNYCLP